MHGWDGSYVEFNGPVSMKLITTCPDSLWKDIKEADKDMVHARFMPQVFGHRPDKDSLVMPVRLNGERTMMELIESINRQVSGMTDIPLKLVAMLIGDVRYIPISTEQCDEDDIPNPVFVERKKNSTKRNDRKEKHRYSAHNSIR